jgi:hypothetical protein
MITKSPIFLYVSGARTPDSGVLGLVERLRENLAEFKQECFKRSRNLYQDVTCKRSIYTILVQILKFFIGIGRVVPPALYTDQTDVGVGPAASRCRANWDE